MGDPKLPRIAESTASVIPPVPYIDSMNGTQSPPKTLHFVTSLLIMMDNFMMNACVFCVLCPAMMSYHHGGVGSRGALDLGGRGSRAVWTGDALCVDLYCVNFIE